jgi:hypothetical protein
MSVALRLLIKRPSVVINLKLSPCYNVLASDAIDVTMHIQRLEHVYSVLGGLSQFFQEDEFRMMINRLIQTSNLCKHREEQLESQIQENRSNIPNRFTEMQRLEYQGRPTIVVEKSIILYFREMHYNWGELASVLDISLSTLQRRRIELDIQDPIRYSSMSDSELDRLVVDIRKNRVNSGQILIQGVLEGLGM